MKINYVVICFKQLDDKNIRLKHKCLYEEEPNDMDLAILVKELETDSSFNMIGDDDYEMIVLSREFDSEFMNDLNIPEEITDTEYDNRDITNNSISITSSTNDTTS
jgi:adenine-specific DNA methylase